MDKKIVDMVMRITMSKAWYLITVGSRWEVYATQPIMKYHYESVQPVSKENRKAIMQDHMEIK